jgi:threonine dehydrogenase-like Zn-dependent dehydrogenase
MKGYGMIRVGAAGWLEKPEPVCGPTDAIIRPTIVAPCSSDTHVLHGGSGPKENLILGHEAVGIVERVGADVRYFCAGDFVVVPCVTPDWLSPGVQNRKSFSHDTGMMGSFKFLENKNGVFAEFFHVNQADANLVRLPEGVSPEAALMTVDMVSTGFHAAELADVQYGDTVVVIGIGPVGLMAVAASVMKGAGRVIAIGTRPTCVAMAREYGATDVIGYKGVDIVKEIRRMTDGRRADCAIVTGGSCETLGQAIAMVRETGTVGSVNYFDVGAKLEFSSAVWGMGMSNKDIRCGFCPGGAERIRRMLEMVKYGRLDPEKLITHKFYGFDKIPEAFTLMDEKSEDLIKPIVYME